MKPKKIKVLDWHGLYKEGWKGEITADAFQHPAKFSRGLIRKIYQHMTARGWLQSGDTCLDPFGGVALGGLEAMQLGCHWIGVELEAKFVALGNANIALWNQRYSRMPHWGTAILLRGDSRELLAVLGSAGIEASVSSPPYAESLERPNGIDSSKSSARKGGPHSQMYGDPRYSAALSSPPYSEARIGQESGQEHCGRGDAYGATEGQLGAMKAGELDAAVSSPPFGEQQKGGGIFVARQEMTVGRRGAGYGNAGVDPANLGNLDAAVTSPPWEKGAEGVIRKQKFKDPAKFAKESSERGGNGNWHAASEKAIFAQLERDATHTYGETEGNVGNASGETFWTAARTIVEQTYAALRPGAHAAWVVKSFVRNKAIVDFPDQWRKLCEAVGFETVEIARAWLVEDGGTRIDLNGDHHKKTTERKSFFRRLAEKNGSPRIDYEQVIFMRKVN